MVFAERGGHLGWGLVSLSVSGGVCAFILRGWASGERVVGGKLLLVNLSLFSIAVSTRRVRSVLGGGCKVRGGASVGAGRAQRTRARGRGRCRGVIRARIGADVTHRGLRGVHRAVRETDIGLLSRTIVRKSREHACACSPSNGHSRRGLCR